MANGGVYSGSMVLTRGLKHFWKIVVLLAILAWILLFALGIIINSQPYREVLAAYPHQVENPDLESITLISAGIMVILCYTPINIALLSILSGLLGVLGSKARLHLDADHESPADMTNPYLSGILRGFVVYVVILSGVLIIVDTPITNPTQVQYVRLAGLISVLSFYVSYDPGMFGGLLKRAGEFLNKE